jgi:hypothetical protein
MGQQEVSLIPILNPSTAVWPQDMAWAWAAQLTEDMGEILVATTKLNYHS